jgi:hypothetical protein
MYMSLWTFDLVDETELLARNLSRSVPECGGQKVEARG